MCPLVKIDDRKLENAGHLVIEESTAFKPTYNISYLQVSTSHSTTDYEANDVGWTAI